MIGARLSIAALLLAAPAVAGAMTVEDYLIKTEALKAKGVLAMTSPDVATIRSEMQGIKTSYRADVDAARAKGKSFMGCPPPAGQAIGLPEINAALLAIPAEQRKRTSLKAGVYRVLRDRYPCK